MHRGGRLGGQRRVRDYQYALLLAIPGTARSLTLDQLLEKFVLEAIFRKEISRSTNTRDITNLLMATFMGGIVIAHTNHLSPLKMYYRRNVEMVLKGLQQ